MGAQLPGHGSGGDQQMRARDIQHYRQPIGRRLVFKGHVDGTDGKQRMDQDGRFQGFGNADGHALLDGDASPVRQPARAAQHRLAQLGKGEIAGRRGKGDARLPAFGQVEDVLSEWFDRHGCNIEDK